MFEPRRGGMCEPRGVLLELCLSPASGPREVFMRPMREVPGPDALLRALSPVPRGVDFVDMEPRAQLKRALGGALYAPQIATLLRAQAAPLSTAVVAGGSA